METRPLVVILGDSILMNGVAISMAGNQFLEMTHLDAHAIDVRQRLFTLKPDLVIFELDTPPMPCILALLWEQPGIPLIGLDLARSRAIVLNSQQLDPSTLDDLCRMVQTQVSEGVHVKGGSGN